MIEGGQDIGEFTIRAGDAYIDFIYDTDQWIIGAVGDLEDFGNDVGDWLINDLDDYVVDFGGEVEDWIVDIGEDITDWTEGAIGDTGEFLVEFDDWIDDAADNTGEWFIGAVEDAEVLFEGAG